MTRLMGALRWGMGWAAGTLLWLTAAMAADQTAQPCAVPEDLEYSDLALPHVAARLHDNQPVRIAVMGSGSSAGLAAGSPDHAYPERLAEVLDSRFPKGKFEVSNFSKRGQLAGDMVRRFRTDVLVEKPALVIWQTGTVDAVRNIDVGRFSEMLDEGIDEIVDSGADAVLMNMQYSPHTSALLNIEPYRERMRWVSQSRSVILFDRFSMMKYWEEAGAIDFSNPSKAEQARADDFVQGCIARILGDVIETAVKAAGEGTVKRQ